MKGPDIPDSTQMIPQAPGAAPVSLQARTASVNPIGGARTGGVQPYNPTKMQASGGPPPGDPRMDAIMSLANSKMGGI